LLALLACVAARPIGGDDTRRFALPNYTQSSIVHAASFRPGPLAPNMIATLFGTDLTFSTRGISSGDIRGGLMPFTLPGTGVRVLVGGLAAPMYYASPRQINFLVPANLIPGDSVLAVVFDGKSGPSVRVKIAPAAPGVFAEDGVAAAVREDGTVVSEENPALAGRWVTVYATGLGATRPRAHTGELPIGPAPLDGAELRVLLGGADVEEVDYGGLAPGFPGLYQINARLPMNVEGNPELRIAVDGLLSPEGVRLPARKPMSLEARRIP
jgi:uncharacterized protein (TIGR03437 family)